MASGAAESASAKALEAIYRTSPYLCAIWGFVALCYQFTTPVSKGSRWFADPSVEPSRAWMESFVLKFSVFWMSVMAAVVATQAYESLDANGYMLLCVGLAAPAVLCPLLFPCASERSLPLSERYSMKANVWIAIYSFIGNYFCTHYFYCVLKASYSCPGWRLNDVPIPFYFATHFYFLTYHFVANLVQRRIVTGFAEGPAKRIFLASTVLGLAYSTAFMETFTISGYPYYSFEDRNMAYTLGSAFYAIYLVVSYPMFYRVSEDKAFDMTRTVLESFGACMIIITLLDLVRGYLGIEFRMSGLQFEL